MEGQRRALHRRETAEGVEDNLAALSRVPLIGPAFFRRGTTDDPEVPSLLASEPPVVVGKFVTGDRDDPRDRVRPPVEARPVPHRLDERFLGQLLGHRPQASAPVEEVAVHTGDGPLVPLPERPIVLEERPEPCRSLPAGGETLHAFPSPRTQSNRTPDWSHEGAGILRAGPAPAGGAQRQF